MVEVTAMTTLDQAAFARLEDRILARIRGEHYATRKPVHLSHLLSRYKRSKGVAHYLDAVPGVIESLQIKGLIVYHAGNPNFILPVLKKQGTDEERYALYLQNLSVRLLPTGTEVQRAKLVGLFRRIRECQKIHTLDERLVVLRKGRIRPLRSAFLAPESIRIHPDGSVKVETAILIMVSSHGFLVVRRVKAGSIKLQWEGDSLVSVHVICRNVQKNILNPVQDKHSNLPGRSRSIAPWMDHLFHQERFVMNGLFDEKEMSSFLGALVRKTMIKKFNAAVSNKSRQNSRILAHFLFGALDQDLRRLCLKSPQSSIELYQWFSVASVRKRLRRRQAAEAFPFFVKDLQSLEAVIDNGGELLPALAKKTKLPVTILRRLRGQPWQRMLPYMQMNYSMPWPFSSSVRLSWCLPEKVPNTRKDWKGFSNFHTILKLPGERHEKLMREVSLLASQDWGLFNYDQNIRRVEDALRDIRQNLIGAIRPHVRDLTSIINRWEGDTQADTCIGEFITIAMMMGKKPSRVLQVTDEWHERMFPIRQRLADLRYQILHGDVEKADLESWLPLDENYTGSDGGRLVWLTTPEALECEGLSMHHCVGSYTNRCLIERSHIAQVFGASGGRSTVEFQLFKEAVKDGHEWRLRVIQNYTFHDKAAPTDCAAVVQNFMQERMPHINFKRLEEERAKRHTLMPEGLLREELNDPVYNDEVVRLYRSFLAKGWRNASRDQIITAVRQHLIETFADKLLKNDQFLQQEVEGLYSPAGKLAVPETSNVIAWLSQKGAKVADRIRRLIASRGPEERQAA